MVTSMTKIGNVRGLLAEINAVLHLDLAQDVMETRAQLQNATFEKEGMCTLLSWKFFVNHQVQRLKLLGAPYTEPECVATFLKGLPAIPFSSFRQQIYNTKETFVQVAERARAYAAQPDSKLPLEQLLASKQRSGNRAAPQIFGVTPALTPTARLCFDFVNENCVRDVCRFVHSAAPTPARLPPSTRQRPSCSHCAKSGHTADVCFSLNGYPPDHKRGEITGKRGRKGGKGHPANSQNEKRSMPHRAAAKSYMIKAFAQQASRSDDSDDMADMLKGLLEQHKKSKLTSNADDQHETRNYSYMLKPKNNSATCAIGNQNKSTTGVLGNKDERINSRAADKKPIDNAIEKHHNIGSNLRHEINSQQVILNLGDNLSADISQSILLDGGASIHATNRLDACFDIVECGETVGGVGGEFVCKTKGSIVIKTDKNKLITLTGVFMSDKFPLTVISESRLLDKGCAITKAGTSGTVIAADGNALLSVIARMGLFLVNGHVLPLSTQAAHVPVCAPITNLNFGKTLLARAYSKPESNLDRLSILHRRMQHASFPKVAAAYGLKLPPGFTTPFCEACVMAKSANHPHHEGARLEAVKRYQGLHCDFCGPFPCASLSGARYLLIFIDSFTGYVWDFYPATQSEFYDIWHLFMARLDNESRRKNAVSWIRSDNAKVFSVPRVVAECAERGIRQEFSAPYSQWQNGKAERCFGTVLPLAAASLFQSGLSEAYWEYAIRLAIVSTNRIGESSSKNISKGFEPNWSKWERLLGKSIPTRLNGIYPFGCSVYKHVPAELRRKFENRSEPAIYLGLAPSIKGVVVLSIKDSKRSVTATFIAHESFFPLKPSFIEPASLSFQREHSKEGAVTAPTVFWPSSISDLSTESLRDPRLDFSVAAHDEIQVSLVPVRRSLRDRPASTSSVNANEFVPDKANLQQEPSTSLNPVLHFAPGFGWLENDHDKLQEPSSVNKRVVFSIDVNDHPLTRHDFLRLTPISHKAAMRGPHYQFWFPAELREVASHLKNGTFGPRLSAPPCGFNSIGMGFVYRNKCTAESAVLPSSLAATMFKVRAVVKGYTMVSGVDYGNTFAPTPSPTSIRLMIALSVQLGYKLKAADVETAFLQANMDKEVYVSMPAGYETCIATLTELRAANCDVKNLQTLVPKSANIVVDDKTSCRRLLKGVPGIKQGSRLFYIKMRDVLVALSFVVCPHDPCVYWRIMADSLTIIAVWVDDLFCMVASSHEWAEIVRNVRQELTLVDKGDVEEFLGMSFKHNFNISKISVSQSISIGNLLQRGAMEDCHPAPTHASQDLF